MATKDELLAEAKRLLVHVEPDHCDAMLDTVGPVLGLLLPVGGKDLSWASSARPRASEPLQTRSLASGEQLANSDTTNSSTFKLVQSLGG